MLLSNVLSRACSTSSFSSIKGMVALVTGAASGLGRATAQYLSEKGAKVVAFDLPASKGNEVASEMDWLYVPGDVRSEEDVSAALQQTKDKFGRLDIAVNCAGIINSYVIHNFNTNKTHQLGDFVDMAMVNILGCFNVIRLSTGLMSQNEPDSHGQRGVFVNTSSHLAFDGSIAQVSLAATSAAIIAMTLPVARDLSPAGIRCCTIAAGFFKTPFSETLPEEVITWLSDTTCFPPRLGDPSEFAHLVQTIICNPMLNGEVIRLDAGQRFQL